MKVWAYRVADDIEGDYYRISVKRPVRRLFNGCEPGPPFYYEVPGDPGYADEGGNPLYFTVRPKHWHKMGGPRMKRDQVPIRVEIKVNNL